MFKALAAVVIVWLSAVSATAQDSYWVQIEARQTLTEAQDQARSYARRLDDVQGYYLGRGYYGIVLGPYTEQRARTELAGLLRDGQIPGDSYLQNGRRFEQQFWPIGGAAARQTPDRAASSLPLVTITQQQETPQQARASEAALPREAREELQKALRWAGFYQSTIDGAFGRGTRRAMEDWQAANNQNPTGVLTTSQRTALLRQYNSILDDVGMKLVRDNESGIQMQVPTALVAFSQYQPPFVKFDPSGSLDHAQVLFISQRGDAGRLSGLFELMQVLDIVPRQGNRRLRDDSFFIEGIGDGIQSFTTVSLQDGEIKGFTLVWPEGDEQRFARILDVMQSSFERLDGTLDPNIVPPSEEQAIDMVAGLSVRQPRLSRSGFYVSSDGIVVTTPQVIDSCTRITFDRDTDAEVIASDLDLGIAILRPLSPLAPIDVAMFQSDIPRLQDRIATGGFPYDGTLDTATLTFGELEDLRDLDGDDRVKRLTILSRPSNAGGPIFDESGAVLGMLLPRESDSVQALPPEVHFSVDASQIIDLLAAQGIETAKVNATPAIPAVMLGRKAANIAVLVSCW